MAKKPLYLVLSAALLLACLTGCEGAPAPEESVTPSGDVTQVPDDIIATPSPDVTPVPENPAEAEREAELDMEFIVEGERETATMTLVSAEFAEGPAVSLYIDRSRYDWIETEDGAWHVARPESWGETETVLPVYSLEINFVKGQDGDSLAPGLLDGYGDILSLEDVGQVGFAGGRARLVTGKSAQLNWMAWIIDRPEGAVTLILRYEPELAEGHAQRLEAIADTIKIVSRY